MKKPNLTEQVYQYLKDAITTGKIAGGSELYESQLSKQLSISKTPIKMALYQLQNDGLIDVIPNVGYRVCKFELQDFIDIMQCREVLEGKAAYLACLKMKPEDIEKMHQIFPWNGQVYDQSKMEEYNIAGEKLHDFLMMKAKNPAITRALRTYEVQIGRITNAAFKIPEHCENAYYAHLSIIKAIDEGNPDKAEACMRKHLKDTAITAIYNFIA